MYHFTRDRLPMWSYWPGVTQTSGYLSLSPSLPPSLFNLSFCSRPPIATIGPHKRAVLARPPVLLCPVVCGMHVPAPYRRSLRKTGIVPAVAPFTKRKKELGWVGVPWIAHTESNCSVYVGSLLTVSLFPTRPYCSQTSAMYFPVLSPPRFGISTADHPWLVFRNERHRAVFGHLVFGLVLLDAKVCDAF